MKLDTLTAQKRILVVDDEKVFLKGLSEHLRLANPEFEVLSANTGVEALKSLEEHRPALLITDVHMPEFNGLELLAAVTHTDLKIPVIVMTAYGTERLESQALVGGAFAFIDKPIDMDALGHLVEQAFVLKEQGQLKGISLEGFLQLLEMERKTCRIRVESRSGEGLMSFQRGELVHALTADQSGDGAALEMLSWPEPRIALEPAPSPSQKNVETSLIHLLMEAAQRKDLKDRVPEEPEESTGEPDGDFHRRLPTEELESLPGFLAVGFLPYRIGEEMVEVGEVGGNAISAVSEDVLAVVGAKQRVAEKIGCLESLEEILVKTREHYHFYRWPGISEFSTRCFNEEPRIRPWFGGSFKL